MDVAGDDGLHVADGAVEDDLAGLRQRGVRGAARLSVLVALLLRVARVELIVGADRPRPDGGVDLPRVEVEDLAYLLARKRLEAAHRESRVLRADGRKAEVAADAGDRIRADAALREGAHERVLDREHLGV